MSKIYIHEVDETTTGNAVSDYTDIAYVPGFSVLTGADGTIYGKPHVPVLCKTVAEFEQYFGATTPTFKNAQSYPDGFAVNAIPTDIDGTPKYMFNANDPDPSYIYAKELLFAGIPVLYERVNELGEDISVEKMYQNLSNIFLIGKDLTIDSVSAGLTASVSAGGETAFYNAMLDGGTYKFKYVLGTTKDVSLSLSTTMGGRTALSYSDESTYSVGEKCTFNGKVFQCIEAIVSPEQFNSTHWQLSAFEPTTFVSIDKKEWLKVNPITSSSQTFEFTYDGTNSKWKDSDSQDVVLTTVGIKASGVLSDGDKITITNGNTGAGWMYDGMVYSSIPGVTVTGSLSEGAEVVVFLEVSDPVLLDRGEYRFKYLTTGGYPSYEYGGKTITSSMASLCAKRGDAVALIDHTDNPARPLSGMKSIKYSVSNSTYMLDKDVQTFATMFTPSVEMSLSNAYRGWSYEEGKRVLLPGSIVMPASFAYLKCLASSIKSNPNWLAIAGASRGKISGLVSVRTEKILTNSIADGYTPDDAVAINPITNVNPYGQCIWGNRTLLDNSDRQGTIATSFLNIRNLVSDIKKQVYVACQSLLFEQNTDVLWVNFLALTTPVLEQMKNGYGISNYKIIKLPNSDRTRINVRIRIYPIYAVESFDITIYLNDKGDYEEVEEF